MPALRTLGSALLSVVIVGMGVSLGREGAPKQAGAVFANFFSDRTRLSDEQRRLLVACGAGAGMGAAYGVPLGGALFALEVMRGMLALRYVLPALFASLVATAVSWVALPDVPTAPRGRAGDVGPRARSRVAAYLTSTLTSGYPISLRM
jgi:chloride channel protein, CIC family